MERFKIIKKEKDNGYFSIKIHDKKENISFWLDCSIIDGFGNTKDYKTEDLYISWEFNQYIFFTDCEEDIKAKEYQENANNIDEIGYFIDENNDDLIKFYQN